MPDHSRIDQFGLRMAMTLKICWFVCALGALVTACGDSGSQNPASGAALPSTQSPAQRLPQVNVIARTWPPELAGVTNVQLVPASDREILSAGVLNAARDAINFNPQVRSLIAPNWNSNYREIEATLSLGKLDQLASIVYFNYDLNQTVIAALHEDGAVSTEVFAASEYQPPAHPDERSYAIYLLEQELARSNYQHNGHADALLAFPSIDNIASVKEHYYPNRLLRVSMTSWLGDSVYEALVDLGTEQVVEYDLSN